MASRSTPHSLAHVTKHARDRMIEAIGRDLQPAEWARVVAEIKAGRALLVAVDDAAAYAVYAVEVAGHVLRFTWRGAQVVTVLRPGLHNHRGVEAALKRGVYRKAEDRPMMFHRGRMKEGRTRWNADAQRQRGSRFLSGEDDEA